MQCAFSDLQYRRPNFDELGKSFQDLKDLLNQPKRAEQKNIISTYRNLSEQFIEALSLAELGRLRAAIDPAKVHPDLDLTWLRAKLDQAGQDYLETFNLMARGSVNFSNDHLENLSILNEARRVARCYGKVNAGLLQAEKDLVREQVDFLSNLSVNLTLNNTSGQLAEHSSGRQSYKCYLADFENCLRQARSQVRRELYFKLAEKLKKSASQVNENFLALVEIRLEQAKLAGLDYFTFIHRSQKGYGFSEKELAFFKTNLQNYFLPIIQEIRRLRNKRLNDEDPYFYNQFKLAKPNPSDLLKRDRPLEKSILAACENIFRDKDSYAFTIARYGYWSGNPNLQRRLGKSIVLLPSWQILFIALAFQQDLVSLDRDFINIGKALADLSGLTNLQDLASFQQSNLVRKLSGLAMFFLAMRQSKIFCGDEAELFNDINMSNQLIQVGYDLALDSFEGEVYKGTPTSNINLSKLWQKQEELYSLNQNYSQDGFFSAGNLWQIQSCLYQQPCQTLDHALALVCILAESPHLDRRNSLEKKLNKLLTSNPDLTFTKRLAVAGFASPFDLHTIRRSAFAACDILKL